MAPKRTNMCLVLVLMVMLWGETRAQSGCTTALIGLAPCLNYVSGNSSTPSPSCCLQLSNVVQAQPQCLCSLLNGGGANLGISINQTAALSLPSACNVQTPPVSRCNGVSNGPASDSPTSNSPPVPSSDEAPRPPTSTNNPTVSISPSGSGGSKSGLSNAGIVRAPDHVLGFAIFVLLCVSTLKKI